MRTGLIFILTAMLAGCASSVPREVRSGEIYQRHAAEEETTSVLFAFVRSWRRAGSEAILIEFNRKRHYLFWVEPRCAPEIPFANAIALQTTTSQRVDRFDRILIGAESCRITGIRAVDFEAVQAELQELQQPLEPPRSTIQTDVIHADPFSGGT